MEIRKNLTVRNQFAQVAAEHPRACLNGMGWNPATSNQTTPLGSRQLVVGDSLVRDLNEIFVSSQTTVIDLGGGGGGLRGSGYQENGVPGRRRW